MGKSTDAALPPRPSRPPQWVSSYLLAAALVGCAADGGTSDAAASAALDDGYCALRYVVDVDTTAAAGAATIARGWVTLASLTALACSDVAAASPAPSRPSCPSRQAGGAAGLLEAVGDLLVAPAYAGHSELGLTPWQVAGSEVVALHVAGARDYGLAVDKREALCSLHLLLGRAERDAPSLSVLPAEVTMARMTLHLELSLGDGSDRMVRTDVGWGRVAEVAPALAAGEGSARVTLRPGAALDAVAAQGLLHASDKDLGRAFLVALLDGASVAFSAD